MYIKIKIFIKKLKYLPCPLPCPCPYFLEIAVSRVRVHVRVRVRASLLASCNYPCESTNLSPQSVDLVMIVNLLMKLIIILVYLQKEVVVQHLYMGRSPPMITKMRVLQQSTSDDHLVCNAVLAISGHNISVPQPKEF